MVHLPKFLESPKAELITKILIVIWIFALGTGVGLLYNSKKEQFSQQVAGTSQNKYITFIDEVYATIQENYWNKISEEDLNKLFLLGTSKLTGQAQTTTESEIKTKAELENYITKVLDQFDSEQKRKDFTTQLSDIVLANLEPFGRSRLYTQKDEQALSNNVQNKNPDIDHYQELGLTKGASQSAIAAAFEKESAKWDPKTNTATEAAQKYQKIQEAYKVLKDDAARETYDKSGVETTIDYKNFGDKIFYMHLTKFSPTTLDDLNRVTEQADKVGTYDSLIFDLRDNIGGAIDGLPYFLGPFIGNDQYAYQFFHQGEKSDYKTKIGWLPSLVRYKKVVILINQNSQSSAEVMAAVLKKYNVGVLVGLPTKGWGTVERVFPLKNQLTDNEKHSVFLVHSLTLREDGQPIQGKGVEPAVNVSTPNWEQELLSYHNYPELVAAVKEIMAEEIKGQPASQKN